MIPGLSFLRKQLNLSLMCFFVDFFCLLVVFFEGQCLVESFFFFFKQGLRVS